MTTAATSPGDWLVGPARVALNHSEVSIHDPEHARRLGFRGSAVGGNLHLDIFAPLLVRTFGPAWFERGALSLYFLNVVVSGERVEALVEPRAADGEQVRIRARRADAPDFEVCEGTASLGDHSRSALSVRDLRTCDPDRLRIFRGVRPGQAIGRETLRVAAAEQLAQIESGGINEPMDWYVGPSPWGGPIASVGSTASLMFRLVVGDGAHPHYDRISPAVGEAAGMFGAFEIAYVNGPVRLDQDYVVSGRVVGVGESPKTEYVWWDAEAADAEGRTVARMRHLLRFIKASSPLYPELSRD